jgi:RND family efflux transporter MFP subunit
METKNSNPPQAPIRQSPQEGRASNQRRKRINWAVIVVLATGLVCVLALRTFRASANVPVETTAMATVAVAKVAREDLAQEQDFEAEFRPYQEIDLHAKVAGFVKTINVDIGDQVKQGDLLATLEIPELKEDMDKAEAQELRNEKEIDRAAAAYDDAHLAFTRLEAVNKTRPNLVAQQELDTAKSHDSAADAALAVAKQEVQVSKAEVNKLRTMLDYCKITAPFSGVVTKRYADEGSLVQGGVSPSATAMPLVRLSQNDRLRLDFPVSVSYVERIKQGDPVEIRIQAMGKTISGKICRFTRKVNTDTRTMEAEVDVPNADFALTPGVYAIAAMKLDRREKVLTVPAEAISNHRAPTVLVLNKDNVLEEHPVTLGLETADRLEVVSGVNENDLVMIGSRSQVKPGQKVEPKLTQLGSAQ